MKILVITPRCFHLGYIGCYGNDWIDTPTLDRLATEGVVFDRHYADVPDAEGACRSWRTGRYFLPDFRGEIPVAEPTGDLLALLRQHGIWTMLIRDESRPSAVEFATGWDRLVQVAHTDTQSNPWEHLRKSLRPALKRLAKVEHGILWLDLATLIPPWEVPEPFRTGYFAAEPEDDEEEIAPEADESLSPWPNPSTGPLVPQDSNAFQRLQATYAGAVAYFDQGLESLWTELERQELLEEIVLIVTTDQGMPLGEHSYVGLHRPWLHEELIHLPLLCRFPNRTNGDKRISALTQPIDLMPTLLELFGIASPSLHGKSLLPLIQDQTESLRTYACSGLRLGEDMAWSLRTAAWCLLVPIKLANEDEPNPRELYVKPDDRWEVNNIAQHHAEFVEQLEQTLHGFIQAAGQPGPLQAPELSDIKVETSADNASVEPPT